LKTQARDRGREPGVGFQLSMRNQLEIGMHVNEFDLKHIWQIVQQ
jgi:hypothetical protein